MAGEIRQTMVEHAVLLLARKGLQGASLSEILQASGAPRGSLYHHFPGGKDELVLAALDESDRIAANFLVGLEGLPAIEVVNGFTSLWRSILVEGDMQVGCAVVAVTVAADSPLILERAGKVFSTWRKQLAKLLIAGGISKARAPGVAALVISGCEGATMLARAEKSLKPFDLVVSEVRRIVEAATSG